MSTTTAAFDLRMLDTRVQPCPLCGGATFEVLAKHDRNLIGLTTVGCHECGLVQTNPRPSSEGLNIFYRDHYRLFYQGAIKPDATYIANLNKDVRLARTAGFFTDELGLPQDSTVLDFGCGEGSLFAALRKVGFTGSFYGVELNASFGEYASKYGNAVVSNSIRAPEPIDFITVIHVLEHLADPVDSLTKLASLLRRDTGRIYIDVPDVEAYESIHDLHIAHLYHFSDRTLAKLVEKAGFRVLRVEKHQPLFHPRSIRLVAVPGLPDAPAGATSPVTERAAWAATRRSGRALNTLRLRLRRIPFLRKAYQMAKRISDPRSQP